MSLKKIAKELGLSLTTVSRALNGYQEVSASTRVAVQAAAARLKYQPDARARALANGRVDAVGIVFPITPGDLGDPMFLEVIHALGESLAAAGLDLLIISATASGELASYRRAIMGKRVAAFVVPRTRCVDERLGLLQASSFPFVAYGRSEGFEGPYAWLDYDNEAGARMATDRLLAWGHRRIAYLGASADYNFAAQRFRGYEAALRDAGVPADPLCVRRDALDRRSGHALTQLLLQLPQPPTALFVDNHLAGVGAIHAALQAGLVLGRDLSVIVYDGPGPDSVIRTPITSVGQPTPALAGEILAALTLDLLKGVPPAELQRLREPLIVPGESDGPPRATLAPPPTARLPSA